MLSHKFRNRENFYLLNKQFQFVWFSVKEHQGQGPHFLKTQQFLFIVVEIMQILIFKGDSTFNLLSWGPRQGLLASTQGRGGAN